MYGVYDLVKFVSPLIPPSEEMRRDLGRAAQSKPLKKQEHLRRIYP